MKKKIFSLLAVVMFAGSLISASPNIEEEYEDCTDRAYIVMHQALNVGHTVEDATWFMNAAYAICSGYSLEDIDW